MKRGIQSLFKKISLLVFFLLITFSIYIHLPFVFLKNHTCIYVHPGEKFHEFTLDVAAKTRHVSPLTLKIYSKFKHLDRHLEVGEYCFNEHASIVDIMTNIGRANRELHKYTLVDGWTYQQMVKYLRASPALSDVALLESKSSVATVLGLSQNDLEGQFYPNTYYYAYPDTALVILQQAHDAMSYRIHNLYQESQTQAFFKTPYELLIVASIIQKEASNPVEQALIAGVIINRIKLHMKLQMDATVIYGLGENHIGTLNKQDLRTETPYNSYLHIGLPPSPICMPGETALYAAAHPQETKFLYYVSKKDGTHQFSKTLKEHTEAIEKYLLHQASKKLT
jgi:UPF0755 protein